MGKQKAIICDMKIDKEKIQGFINDGYISVQKHPEAELYIYNYTPKTQFEQFWTEETMMCRGLITDQYGEILYRPFKKFFNLEEHVGQKKEIPNTPFKIYQKIDGSLGILYKVNGQWAIATRGSFTSDQAIHATEVLRKKYGNTQFAEEGVTTLFEIVYPENRIVVDYKDTDDLIFLACIHTETGATLNMPDNLPCPRAKIYEFNDIMKLTEKDVENEEGYVIEWSNGLRLKTKFAEYKRLHRLVTCVNAKTIWELLKNGQSMNEILDRVPDEFYDWVKNVKEELEDRYACIDHICNLDLRRVEEEHEPKSRREYAEAFQVCKYPSILFKMLDKQPYADVIWKMIRPVASKPFKNDTDL